jgi:hypothetical protein
VVVAGWAVRQTGMDRQTLRDWVHRYNEAGVNRLILRVAPGAAPKLTEAQMTELRNLVIAGPDPEVHKVVRWRCIDLRAQKPGTGSLASGSKYAPSAQENGRRSKSRHVGI